MAKGFIGGAFIYKRSSVSKLDYLHNNPTAVHWQLVKDPCDYKYSTARYYERGEKDYSFIKDLREEFKRIIGPRRHPTEICVDAKVCDPSQLR